MNTEQKRKILTLRQDNIEKLPPLEISTGQREAITHVQYEKALERDRNNEKGDQPEQRVVTGRVV